MQAWRLPITPKFFEELFEQKEQYCFMALRPERVKSLYKRHHKKGQMSTFTDYKDTSIFWGAGNLNWYNYYEDNVTFVGVMKGKVTVKGTSDLWTFYETQGRRWIDIKAILRYNTELSRTLGLIQEELQKKFIKKLDNLDLEHVTYHVTEGGNMSWQNTWEKGQDFKKIITAYFDCSYDAIRKYKKELQKSYEIGISELSKYNEHLCYDYKVQKLYIISENPSNTRLKMAFVFDNLLGKDFEFVTKDELHQNLQKLQSINKKRI